MPVGPHLTISLRLQDLPNLLGLRIGTSLQQHLEKR